MKLLLDTHIALWASHFPRKLPVRADALLRDPDHEVYFSVVNLWEAVLKRESNEDFHVNPMVFRKTLFSIGFRELEVRADHVLAVASLPMVHKDPFDRLLIAQAQYEMFTLITVDSRVRRYPDLLFDGI